MKIWKWWIVSDKDVQEIVQRFRGLMLFKMAHKDQDCPYKEMIETTPDLIANTEWPRGKPIFGPYPGRKEKDLEKRALRDVYDEELEILR